MDRAEHPFFSYIRINTLYTSTYIPAILYIHVFVANITYVHGYNLVIYSDINDNKNNNGDEKEFKILQNLDLVIIATLW